MLNSLKLLLKTKNESNARLFRAKKLWDMTIYDNSKIKNIPKILKTGALIFRNFQKPSIDLTKFFVSDGVITKYNMSVTCTTRMKYSLEIAVKNCAWDYKIPMRLHQAIWCVDNVLLNQSTHECCFVELGTGRGFIMSGILASREFIGLPIENPVYLFDTFLPYKLGDDNNQSYLNGINPYYAISFENTKKNFSKWENVKLIQGDLPLTLKTQSFDSIGFLHLDLNNAKVEYESLKFLWQKIALGVSY